MISIADVEKIHNVLIDRFGGTHGLRDKTALESALARPFQTFDNKELYPTAIQKAACLIESLISNHPFIDGNKRTGYTIMRLFLLNNHQDILADHEEKYRFVMDVAAGNLHYEQIVEWLERHAPEKNAG